MTSRARRYFPGKAPVEVQGSGSEHEREKELKPRRAVLDPSRGVDKGNDGKPIHRRRRRVEAEVLVPGRDEIGEGRRIIHVDVEDATRRDRKGERRGSGGTDDELKSPGGAVRSEEGKDAVVGRVKEEEESEEEESEEEESEEEESEEEDEMGTEELRPMLKPVFISRENRKGLSMQQVRKEEEETLEAFKEKRKAERRGETKDIVRSIVIREEQERLEEKDHGLMNADMPDDEDREEDRETEFEQWKVREFKRVIRERKEAEGEVNEENEEDQTRKQEETENQVQSKMGYLQKYYHRGAFFMETDDRGVYKEKLYRRNFNEQTAEDKAEKLKLPKILQMRRGLLGKSGRSKYTNLRDEDTAYEEVLELKKDKKMRHALARLHSGKRE